MKIHHIVLTALSAAMLMSPVQAQSGSGKGQKAEQKQRDHDIARQAVLRREVLPLPRILKLAGTYQPGDVIEIELKNKDGVILYDVDVLVSTGEVRDLKIDARTGKLLQNQPKGR
ncbi:MAG: PepSY domain-containing protein [Pseudomonadota bacterium]